MHGPEHHLHLLLIGAARDSADRLTSHLREAGALPRATQAATLAELEPLLSRTWDVAVCHATPTLDTMEVLRRCERQQVPLILIASRLEDVPKGCHEHLPDDTGPEAARLARTVLRAADHSRLRRRLAQLERHHAALGQRHDLLLEQSVDAYSYLQDGMHLYCNPSYAALFGYDTHDAVRATPLLNLVQREDRAALRAVFAGDTTARELTLRGLRRDGSSLPLRFRFTPVDYQGTPCMLLGVREASAAPEAAHSAMQDLVTGLDNQAGLEATLAAAVHAAAQTGAVKTLVLVTLSDYPELAAVLGKPALRVMLQDVARHLAQHAPYVARLREHEFALLRDEDDPVRALNFCRDLQRGFGAALSAAVPAALDLGCDVGMALIDARSTTAELLARARGRSAPQAMDEAGAVLAPLNQALRAQTLQPRFQSVTPLRAAAPMGDELLPGIADIDPALLRQSAALGGLDAALDRQLLSHALRLPPAAPLWYALSAASWQSAAFLPWLSTQLQALRAAPALHLALSEIDVLRQRAEATAFCQGLAQLGFGFALHHFGGALQPFAWLRELHQAQGPRPALLQLDPALLRDLATDEERQARVRALIEGAHALALPISAPDVADLNLLPLLWRLGVDYVQGSALGASTSDFPHAVIPAGNLTTTAGTLAARETTWH